MFEDSLVESGGRLRTRRGVTTTLSFVLQIIALGIMILIPRLFDGFRMTDVPSMVGRTMPEAKVLPQRELHDS